MKPPAFMSECTSLEPYKQRIKFSLCKPGTAVRNTGIFDLITATLRDLLKTPGRAPRSQTL